jgi:hypothetical protein
VFFLRCALEPAEGSTRGAAVGHCWSDLGSLDEARFAAIAMAGDAGWAITAFEAVDEVVIEEFDEAEREHFQRAEVWGVSMVVYTDPAAAPVRRKPA